MRHGGIVAIAAIAVVAGCTSSGGRSPSPPPSSAVVSDSSTPTTTSPPPPTSTAPTSPSVVTTGPNVRPGEKPPVLPRLANAHTSAAQVPFAVFWISTWDWAYATTDPTLMLRYSESTCADCKRAVAVIDGVRAKHEHFLGGRFTLIRFGPAPTDGRFGAEGAADVTFSVDALQVVGSNGVVVERDAAVASITFRLWVAWRGNGWIVVEKGHAA